MQGPSGFREHIQELGLVAHSACLPLKACASGIIATPSCRRSDLTVDQGCGGREGELIEFRSPKYPDWPAVMEYMRGVCEG